MKRWKSPTAWMEGKSIASRAARAAACLKSRKSSRREADARPSGRRYDRAKSPKGNLPEIDGIETKMDRHGGAMKLRKDSQATASQAGAKWMMTTNRRRHARKRKNAAACAYPTCGKLQFIKRSS